MTRKKECGHYPSWTDDGGVHIVYRSDGTAHMGLGNRRLSIIDLPLNANRPSSSSGLIPAFRRGNEKETIIMRESHLKYMVCIHCRGELMLTSVTERAGPKIQTGQLTCSACHTNYPIVGHIPRFVPTANYASNFGLEWTIHATTQYDSYTGLKLSEKRFFEETRWSSDLSGQLILEAGSGSGRFTEHAASTNGFVCSFDYSYAVEANYQSNGNKENVLIVQADIYQLPFRLGTFDKLFCFGVLQHTPDVRKTLMALPPMLKKEGELVADVYKKTFLTFLHPKYYVRPFTRNMEPQRLYGLTKRYVDLMWPLSSLIRKIPKIGPSINWRLLVGDYSAAGLKGQSLKEWAYLDTFDMLSPRYDSPQTISTFRRWFFEAGLTEIEVNYERNVIVGRGKKADVRNSGHN